MHEEGTEENLKINEHFVFKFSLEKGNKNVEKCPSKPAL